MRIFEQVIKSVDSKRILMVPRRCSCSTSHIKRVKNELQLQHISYRVTKCVGVTKCGLTQRGRSGAIYWGRGANEFVGDRTFYIDKRRLYYFYSVFYSFRNISMPRTCVKTKIV